jgi:hypothetical protein
MTMQGAWHDYVQESDKLAFDAKRHANATRVHHQNLVELYDRPAKTERDWTAISQLIVTVRAGYEAAGVLATLSQRAAILAELTERTER